MQTSGLLLDIYDDFRGEVMRSVFPTLAAVPEFLKEGHALSPEERHLLSDDAYALVLINEGEKLRKYACTDASNTALSVLYFVKNAHKLPANAQQVAAENLEKACGWYRLEELAKTAGLAGWAVKGAVNHVAAHPLDTAMKASTVGALAQGVPNEIKGRMAAVHQLEGQGHGVVTPEQVAHAMGKHAELTGTELMPIQGKSGTAPTPTKAVINKTGSLGHLVPGGRGAPTDLSPNLASETEKNPTHHAQAKSLKPHVDVTNHAPPQMLSEKKASRHALGTRYPLDTYEQVKRASVYFNEFAKHFSPDDRRSFAINTVTRANELALPVGDLLQKYASATYAPIDEIKMALDARRQLVLDETQLGVLTLLEEKRASLTPDFFCETLKEFDKEAGLQPYYDQTLVDPYLSTFGFEKKAQEKDDWSWIDGNTYVTAADLRKVVKTRVSSLTQTFGESFMNEFRKDPIGIFESLPRDQKRMVAAMTIDNNPGSDLNP